MLVFHTLRILPKCCTYLLNLWDSPTPLVAPVVLLGLGTLSLSSPAETFGFDPLTLKLQRGAEGRIGPSPNLICHFYTNEVLCVVAVFYKLLYR